MGKRPAAQQPPSATLERRLLATVGNSGHAALDVDELAALLRDRFPEYKRQKAGPFAIQVDRALGALTAQGSLAGKVCHEHFMLGLTAVLQHCCFGPVLRCSAGKPANTPAAPKSVGCSATVAMQCTRLHHLTAHAHRPTQDLRHQHPAHEEALERALSAFRNLCAHRG